MSCISSDTPSPFDKDIVGFELKVRSQSAHPLPYFPYLFL